MAGISTRTGTDRDIGAAARSGTVVDEDPAVIPGEAVGRDVSASGAGAAEQPTTVMATTVRAAAQAPPRSARVTSPHGNGGRTAEQHDREPDHDHSSRTGPP